MRRKSSRTNGSHGVWQRKQTRKGSAGRVGGEIEHAATVAGCSTAWQPWCVTFSPCDACRRRYSCCRAAWLHRPQNVCW